MRVWLFASSRVDQFPAQLSIAKGAYPVPAQSSSTNGSSTEGAWLQSKPGASNEQAVIHPYVLAAAPVLFFYSVNIHHYDFPALVRPLVIVTAMMLISWRLLGRIMRRKKAALLVGYFLFMSFTHGYINDVAEAMGYQLDPVLHPCGPLVAARPR